MHWKVDSIRCKIRWQRTIKKLLLSLVPIIENFNNKIVDAKNLPEEIPSTLIVKTILKKKKSYNLNNYINANF